MLLFIAYIRKFTKWWRNQNFFVFSIVTVLLSSFIVLPFGIFSDIFFPEWFLQVEEITENKISEHPTFLSSFLVLCIIVPILETFLFQHITINLIELITKNKYVLVIVSALLFGFSHYFNVVYFITTTLIGFVYAAAYIIGKRHKSKTFAFWSVALAHAIQNLIVISSELIASK